MILEFHVSHFPLRAAWCWLDAIVWLAASVRLFAEACYIRGPSAFTPFQKELRPPVTEFFW